jgi:hypothetical protein
LTPSLQVGATQTLAAQTPLAQSVAARQPRPSAQRGQVPPPQSTSVSAPFLTPSMHEGAAQMPAAQ